LIFELDFVTGKNWQSDVVVSTNYRHVPKKVSAATEVHNAIEVALCGIDGQCCGGGCEFVPSLTADCQSNETNLFDVISADVILISASILF